MNVFKLLLPALIPGWNFFDVISASPRIQYTLLQSENDASQEWIDFRPRPEKVSCLKMLGRMFYNAHWNETLFITSCAERLLSDPTKCSENVLVQRLINDLMNRSESPETISATLLQIRIVIIKRVHAQLQQEVAYISPKVALATEDNR